MTQEPQGRTRPMRATLIGIATDQADPIQRVTRTPNGTIVGGSRQSHEHLREMALRLELELDRLGVELSQLSPSELAEVAWRIDSPEMLQFAIHMDNGLRRRDIPFHESSPELLMEISLELMADSL
jgi:hypothetical protein